MSERLSLNLGIVAAIIVALLMIALSEHAVADTTCPNAGEVPATAADVPAMLAAGISNAAVGVCWNPNSVTLGAAAGQAKADLSQMVCNSGVNIQGLDSNFAVCADKFMKALRQASPSACVRDGYRTAQQQLSDCIQICGQSSCPGKCAPPGQSFHQRGLAIDVSGISNNQQAWQIAISSTNSGIVNPSGLHSSDPNHFQASGSSCSGAPVPQSDTTDYYTGTQTAPQTSNGYCLVSTEPIVAVPCGSTPSTQKPLTTSPFASSPNVAAQSPLQCTPQNYCSGNTLYSMTTACTTVVSQTCQYGCSGTVCSPSPSQSSSGSLQTPSNPSGTLSPATFASSTSLSLNVTLSEAVGESTSSPNNSVITTIIAGNETANQSGVDIGQTTFSSSGSSNTVSSQPALSPIQQLLADLRAVLDSVLNYFNPSAGQAPVQTSPQISLQ